MRAWVEVDLGALVRNATTLAAHAKVPLLPVIKADAYGLGAVPVAHALAPTSPWGYGIATVTEGEALRTAGIRSRIVMFTPMLREEFANARAARLTPTLATRETILEWQQKGGGPWQLAIDTGMQRAGIPWARTAELNDLLEAHPPEAVFTHYHSSELNDGSMWEQDRRFSEAVAALTIKPQLLHADNSAAAVRREKQPYGLIRPGVFLYGVGSGPSTLNPEPVIHLRARVLEVREIGAGETVSYGGIWRASSPRRIATIAIGYADGYRQALTNVGKAFLKGNEVSVVGLVTMDMTMLDVTGVPCEPGDVATLIGRDGDRVSTVEEVAARGRISSYELLTGLRQRLPRVYL